MSVARADHSATLLDDGTVLVAGGTADPMVADLYDPVAGTWTPISGFRFHPIRGAATKLADGGVLFVDWFSERYDPSSRSWSSVGSGNEYAGYRTVTLLPDGNVLAAGGFGEYDDTSDIAYADSEIFDPTASRWQAAGNLAAARFLHTATGLPNGNVLVVGGEGPSPSSPVPTDQIPYITLDSVEQFDIDSATWRPASRLNAARSQHTATLLADGSVLVAGGFADGPNGAYGPNGSTIYLDSAELYGVVIALPPCDKNHFILSLPCRPGN
jgi:hypothetical protein